MSSAIFCTRRPRSVRPLATSLVAAGLLTLAVQARAAEVEPNNDCAQAQRLGKAAATVGVNGLIGEGDVDYFQIDGQAGRWVEIDVARDSSAPGNPMMAGVADSQCVIMTADNARVMALMPSTGRLVFAAAGYGDWSFHGLPSEFGSYRLTAGAPRHAYAVGTVLDGATGAAPAYASALVRLMACTGSDAASCTETVNSTYASDRDGSYYLPLDGIATGSYLLKMTANGFHDPVYSQVMTLGPDAGLVTRNFKLTPPKLPLNFSAVQACSAVKQGADCTLSYQLKNSTTSALSADVWAHVMVAQTVGAVESVEYDVGASGRAPLRVTLQPGEQTGFTQTLRLADMPSGVVGSATLLASRPGHPVELLGSHPGFTWSVTESGTTGPLRPRPQPGANRRVPGAAAEGPTVSGTVTGPDGQPVSASLTLRWCANMTDTVCSQPTLTTRSTASGRYVFRDLAGWSAGRYQVWVDDKAYDQAYGVAFGFDGSTSARGGAVRTRPRTVTLQEVTNCTGEPAQILVPYPATLGQVCTIGYSLTNHGSSALTLDTWVRLLTDRSTSVKPGGSAFLQVSNFSAGAAAGFVPVRITLQPGETQTLSQPLDLSAAPLSTSAGYAVWATPADQPLRPVASWFQGLLTIVP